MDENQGRQVSSPGYYNLRLLVQHENYLDIKQLIKTTTMATEIEKSEQMRIKRMPKMATARNRIG